MISRVKRDFLSKILNVAWGFLLSGTVRIENLPHQKENAPLTDFDKLYCDFSNTCLWCSEGNTDNSWGLAIGEPDQFIWLAATGTNIVPIQPFALLSTKGNGGNDVLASPELLCQQGNGLLEFNYWITNGALVRVCALDVKNGKEIFCSEPLDRNPSPGKASIDIRGPIESTFKLAIISGGEGYVVLDDLRYSAKVCNKSVSSSKQDLFFSLLSLQKFRGFKDDSDSEYLENTDDLVCDFSPEWPCKWAPIDKKVYTVDGSNLDPKIWQERTGTESMPVFPAGFLKVGNAGLRSSIISCQSGDGQIFLRWWASKHVSIRICAVSANTSVQLICSEKLDSLHSEYPGPTVLDFPMKIHEKFTWQIIPDWLKANETNGFVVVDELSYFGDICDSENGTVENTDLPVTAQPETSETSTDSVVTSTSVVSTTKLMTTTEAATTTKTTTTTTTSTTTTTPNSTRTTVVEATENPWKSTDSTKPSIFVSSTNNRQASLCKVLNCDFNRRDTGRFMGALLFPYYTAVLQSHDFQVETVNILHFKYFRASAGANIRLCFETTHFKFANSDELKRCRTIVPELTVENARKWNEVRVMLLPGITKVRLRADSCYIAYTSRQGHGHVYYTFWNCASLIHAACRSNFPSQIG